MTSLSKRKRSQSLVPSSGPGKSASDGKDDFACPICFDMMEEPHVTKCGHTYCFQCISQSLERQKSCPKCSSPVDAVFPNFLLNDLITKHKQEQQSRKKEVSKQNAPGSVGRQVNEIRELLDQKSDQLAIADLNFLILTLRRKKRTLEQTSAYVQNELLKEFLSQARRHKQDQMDQLTRELNQIERDVKRAEEISAALALSSSSDSHSGSCDPASCSTDQLIMSSQARNSVRDSNPAVDSSANASSQQADQQPSSSNGSILLTQIAELDGIHCPSSPSTARLPPDSSPYSLSEKKIKMMAYFDVLETCYLSSRSASPPFPFAAVMAPHSSAASSSHSSVSVSSLPGLQTSRNALSDNLYDDNNYVGLSEFSNTLNQFTSYNGLRPLATLCYTSEVDIK